MAAISGANIVTDGLVYYIDPSNPICYSGSGTSAYNVASSSLVGGTLTNGVTYDYANNGVMYFDGTNDYIAIPDSNLLDLGSNFTISAWIKINDLTTATYHSIYSSLDITTNSLTKGVSLIWYRVNQFGINANSLMIQYGQSAWFWNVYCSDTNTINDTAIHHVVVTVSSANTNNPTVKFYLDGVLKNTTWWGQSSKAAILYSTDTTSLRLGSLYTPANPSYYNSYSNINIYNVQVWKKELSSTEITQIYNATRSRFLITENIVRNGLVFYVDPANSLSYAGSGSYIYDLSGFNNTGTLSNSPSFSKANGGSLVFNGTSSYVNFGNKFSYTTESFTFSYWVFVNSFTTNQANQGPIPFYKGNYNENGYYSQIGSDGSFAFGTNNGSNQFSSSSLAVIKLKKWHHISIVRNGSSVRLYCDGVDVTSTAATHQNPSASSQNFYLANYNNFIFANIQISQFLHYNRDLSAQEVLQNYNATKNKYNILPAVSDSLVLNLDAGNRASYAGTGTTWYDLSGNNLNGTLINGPAYSGTGSSTYISFDGSNDYISIFPTGSTLSYNRSAFTVAGFTYMTSLPTSYYGVILSKWNTGAGNDNEFILNTTDGNLFQFAVDFDDSLTPDSQTNDYVVSTTTIVANTWYYVAATFNNGVMKMYVNGVLENTVTASVSTVKTNTNSSLDIGRFGTIYYSTGRRGLVQLYNRDLSATEILQNFNFYRSRYGI